MPVKFTFSIVNLIAIAGILTLCTTMVSAQPVISGTQERLAAQAAPPQGDSGEGMGMGMMNGGPMMGGQGMMGARQMRGMPMMMPFCGDGMMGPMAPMMMRGMMGSAKDLKTAARMMEMRADMLKASAEVMEKYAKDMEAGK